MNQKEVDAVVDLVFVPGGLSEERALDLFYQLLAQFKRGKVTPSLENRKNLQKMCEAVRCSDDGDLTPPIRSILIELEKWL